MNKQSNSYIIIYATILVVVVAAVLSFVSLTLKPLQQKNVEIEKMGAILQSVNQFQIDANIDYNTAVENQYNNIIKESFLVDVNGEKVSTDSKETFDALVNIASVFAQPAEARKMPVFVSQTTDGKKNYIFPVNGTGLWGPIWGYIAIADDFNTVSGVVFDHASETPGLGAEIATPLFENQFIDKHLFKDGEFVGIDVLKGAGSSKGNDNAVDAISGGTITSYAVKDMLFDCLNNGYKAFVTNMKSSSNMAAQTEEVVENVNVEQ